MQINEREICVYVIMDIFNEGAYNNIILRNTLKKYNTLTRTQKSFITEVVNGTLRNLIYIDYIIDSFSKIKTSKMKPFILSNLRVSIYQIKFMDKVPNSAVCDEAVKLAKKKGFQNLSGFVNGILRNVIRNIDNIVYPNKETNFINYISIKYSYPKWILDYWLESFNKEEVEDICNASNIPPKICACVNFLKTNKNEIKSILNNENIEIEDGNFNEKAIYLYKSSNITDLKSFKDGLFHIMDESSMLVGDILSPEENSIVYDICAAPGGKSFYISELLNNTGQVKAFDIYDHKLELIKKSADRLGLSNIIYEINDATVHDYEKENKADYVLIDAPCSGLGLLRKKPDIKYTKTKDDIDNLVKLQREILSACYNYVKIGGVLVYSTCTISNKENLLNIKWFLENYNYELDSITPYLKNYKYLETADKGYVQFLPNKHNTDGFFIARMIRKG